MTATTYRITMTSKTDRQNGTAPRVWPLADHAAAVEAVGDLCFAFHPETCAALVAGYDAAGELVEVVGVYVNDDAMTDDEINESIAEGCEAERAAELLAEQAARDEYRRQREAAEEFAGLLDRLYN